MCGFIVAFKSGTFPEGFSKQLDESLLKMLHRGPDRTQVWQSQNVLMGFNRLSIVDLSENSDQPIEFDNIKLVMNGELYNYLEIRAELVQQGLKFKSSGDAEVFAAAISAWGPELALQKARGMWSLVAYNKLDKSILVARDRLGIKPLWWARKDDVLVFSSEIKSIQTLFPTFKQKNYGVVSSFLLHGSLDEDNSTFFQGISAFPKGCYLTTKSPRSFKPIPFWELDHSVKEEALSLEELRSVFKETMSVHMRSDVPIGLALSGGIDSTAIASFAKEDRDLECFSLIHPAAQDESPYIDSTVKNWGLKHSYVDCADVESVETIDFLLEKLDQPFKAVQTLYQFGLRKAAAQQGIKVFLTGDGADEVFGGYTKCVLPFLKGLILSRHYKQAYETSFQFREFVGLPPATIAGNAIKGIVKSGLGIQAKLQRPEVHKYLSSDLLAHADNYFPPEHLAQPNNLKSFLRNRLIVTPIPYWLRTDDGISMAVSMENRVPFLDHQLLDQVFRVKEREYLKRGENKTILRDMVAGLIPEQILQSKKKYQRPGSTARFVFDVLWKEIADTLGSAPVSQGLFSNKLSADSFLRDRDARKNAGFWFRSFLVNRWQTVCLDQQ